MPRLPESLTAWWRPIAAVASGLLAWAAFPPLDLGALAWVCFVPLALAVAGQSRRTAFRLGFTAGAVFWLGSICWLTHVTWLGWFLLSLYCALWWGFFAMVAGMPPAEASTLGRLLWPFAGAAVWCACEFARSTFLTGFAWNPLGATQYRNLPLIQVARFGGAYAVGGVLVCFNLALALTLRRWREQAAGRSAARGHAGLLLALLLVAVCVSDGWRRLRALERRPAQELAVALVQPNVSQQEFYRTNRLEGMYARLTELSRGALAGGMPDLVIWPETAIPDYLRTCESGYEAVRRSLTNGVHLLVGAMDGAAREDGRADYYNSSYFFDGEARLLGTYNKQHLVLFGEYIPFVQFTSLAKIFTPIQESFTPGCESTVFRLARPDVAFCVSICFEDTVAGVVRRGVRAGARLLVNQTNDAWFDPSGASRQHMMQCVLRCAENGVPAVRCANTGVSCAIAAGGRLLAQLDDGRGNPRCQGVLKVRVPVPAANDPTFYTRHGDVFGWGCLALTALLLWRRLRA